MHVVINGTIINYGSSIIFFAKKYIDTLYIFESCYLKNTSLYKGKVNVTGASADIVPEIHMKNKKPVIEYQFSIFV